MWQFNSKVVERRSLTTWSRRPVSFTRSSIVLQLRFAVVNLRAFLLPKLNKILQYPNHKIIQHRLWNVVQLTNVRDDCRDGRTTWRQRDSAAGQEVCCRRTGHGLRQVATTSLRYFRYGIRLRLTHNLPHTSLDKFWVKSVIYSILCDSATVN